MNRKKQKIVIIAIVLVVAIVAAIGAAWYLGAFDRQDTPAQNGANSITASGNEGMTEDLYCLISDAENIVVSEENGIPYVNNEVLLYAVEGVSKEEMETLVRGYGGEVVGYIKAVGQYQIQFPDTYEYGELETLTGRIAGEDAVESADLNLAFALDADTNITNDTEWIGEWSESETPGGLNWGVEAIKAPGAWKYLVQMNPVNIGVYDNQFYTNHEDLSFSGTLRNIYEFNETDHGVSHGTHVAGTIAAGFNNEKGIAGVSPNNDNSLFGVSNIGLSSSGNEHYTTLMAFECGFAYLIVENGCSVINISMGTNILSFAASRANNNAVHCLALLNARLGSYLEKIIDNGYEFIICKSSGNQNSASNDAGYRYLKVDEGDQVEIDNDSLYLGYVPYTDDDEYKDIIEKYDEHEVDWGNVNAGYGFITGITNSVVKDRIIVVGAIGLDETGNYYVADFSQTGDRVDVLAPGVDIYSTIWKGGSAYEGEWDGTSMACPHVSGVAAMVFAINPDLAGTDVKKIIRETATESYVSYVNGVDYHHPLVDAEAAVRMALDYGKEFVRISTGDYVGNYIFIKTLAKDVEIRDTDNKLVNTLHAQEIFDSFITNGSVIYYAITPDNNVSVWKADMNSGEHEEVYAIDEKTLIKLLNLGDVSDWPRGIEFNCYPIAINEHYLYLGVRWTDPSTYAGALLSVDLESGQFSRLADGVTGGNFVGNKIIYMDMQTSVQSSTLTIMDKNGSNKVVISDVWDYTIIDNEIYYFEEKRSTGSYSVYLKKCDLNGKNIKDVSGRLSDGLSFGFGIFRENEIYYYRWSSGSEWSINVYNYDTGNQYSLDIEGQWRAYYTKKGNTYILNESNVYKFNCDTNKTELIYQVPENQSGSCNNIFEINGRLYLVMYSWTSDGAISYLLEI